MNQEIVDYSKLHQYFKNWLQDMNSRFNQKTTIKEISKILNSKYPIYQLLKNIKKQNTNTTNKINTSNNPVAYHFSNFLIPSSITFRDPPSNDPPKQSLD